VKFDHRHYVPCLRWKQGEYQAVLLLANESKNLMTPLMEVPEIGFDFETKRPSKTVDEHLAPFAKRVDAKWHGRPCFVDLKLIEGHQRMADGRHPVTFVHDELRDRGCPTIPVFGFDRGPDHQQAVLEAAAQDRRGMCVRVSVEEAAKGLQQKIAALLQESGAMIGDLDLVLDLGAPNFIPVEGFAKVVSGIISRIPDLPRWRTFSVIGTSFPTSMAEVKTSPETITRYEWLLYRKLMELLRSRGLRAPTFGDYGINHPGVLDFDMRLVKPSASIRYAIDDAWFVIKGPNVRDHGFAQYRDHCRQLVSSPEFLGPGFSYGDAYIEQCAAGAARTGNLTTWRQVGTNHHLQKVIVDIASLDAT
jgi:hypothetical protein